MDRERNRALESSRSFWAHIELDKLRGAALAPHLRHSPEGTQLDAPRLSAAPASPHSCRNPSPRHASHPSPHRTHTRLHLSGAAPPGLGRDTFQNPTHPPLSLARERKKTRPL